MPAQGHLCKHTKGRATYMDTEILGFNHNLETEGSTVESLSTPEIRTSY